MIMFDPQHAEFWVMVAFLLFMGVVIYYKVPGSIARSLDARAEAIRKELDEARRLREEAAHLLADYQRKSREAEEEAKVIVDQAKREAEAIAAETRKSLAEQVERRTKVAEEKIARAEAQALSEVRTAAVEAAVGAAEAILKSRVSGATANRLTEESIRSLKGKLN
jgi:F-type H+-transporting ATPase subunit b